MHDNSRDDKQLSTQDMLLAKQYETWKKKHEENPDDVFAYFAQDLVGRYLTPKEVKDHVDQQKKGPTPSIS